MFLLYKTYTFCSVFNLLFTCLQLFKLKYEKTKRERKLFTKNIIFSYCAELLRFYDELITLLMRCCEEWIFVIN